MTPANEEHVNFGDVLFRKFDIPNSSHGVICYCVSVRGWAYMLEPGMIWMLIPF